ncbi:YsnF/AvaK domain-containing protein [Deinococcus yavapaiensis]|uniref:Uncharacterized protein (TIGR02271 family) n=1 Tax=Deinococcus yavapaiensis KR-236 TaxID=694435 RepID=A0A318SNH7_9DEIO|nr:uncharacterized protein (TIGR02271 family) [Deinococcus yavapaiensis KR-236]
MNSNRITAVFSGHQEAESAVAELRRMGVRDDRISILARDGSTGTVASGTSDRPHDEANGAGKGLLAGAGVGALFGLAAAAIPGIGPFITAGTLLSGLGAGLGGAVAGAVVGGAAGSLAGTLAQAGYTEKEAGYYGERVENGAVLVAVDTSGTGNDQAIRDALLRHGGSTHGGDFDNSNVTLSNDSLTSGTMATGTGLGATSGTLGGMSRDSTLSGSSSLSSGTSISSGTYADGDLGSIPTDRRGNYETRYSGYTQDQANSRLTDLDTQLGRADLDETQRLQLLEERLFVEKFRERIGSVEIGKHVETHQQQVSVPLTHTEIVVERHAVTNPTPIEGTVPLGSDSQTIRVDLEAERAQVRKEAYVTEEVEIGKREVSQTQTFTETVGREVLDVNRTGDVEMGTTGLTGTTGTLGTTGTTGVTNTGGLSGTTTGRDDRNLLQRAGDTIDEGVDRLDGKIDRDHNR